MHRSSEQGVTLVELLVTIAILTTVLGGIYGLLESAYRTYNHTRAKLESQQTARIALDYITYRLREIDGGRNTTQPWNCHFCHQPNMDQNVVNNVFMPCTADVTIPPKSPLILTHYKKSAAELPKLDGVIDEFQNMTGNYIEFLADLLPLHGFSEEFTDMPSSTPESAHAQVSEFRQNGRWDWVRRDAAFDMDNDGRYDRGEPEMLEDLNGNDIHDVFNERWTLQLNPVPGKPYYQLVESVNFTSLRPRTRKTNGKIHYDNSLYPAEGYQEVPVAYGLTGLWIAQVKRLEIPDDNPRLSGQSVTEACRNDACHGSGARNAPSGDSRRWDVYGNGTSLDYTRFARTHPWWNLAGLSVEVTAVNTRGRSEQFTKLRQFVNFRNVEINQ